MFYLRGDIGDPLLRQPYLQMRDCFRAAIPALAFRTEPVRIPYDGTALNGYLMTPHGSRGPRPTVLFPAGYDSTHESTRCNSHTPRSWPWPGRGEDPCLHAGAQEVVS